VGGRVTKPFKTVNIKCPVCRVDKETPLFLAWDVACEYPKVAENMAAPFDDPALVGMQAATDAMQGPRRCKKCGASFFLFYSLITRQLRTATKEWLEELKNGETAQHEGSGPDRPDSRGQDDSGDTAREASVQGQGLEKPQAVEAGDKPPASQRAD
jgi:hypothetical protein